MSLHKFWCRPTFGGTYNVYVLQQIQPKHTWKWTAGNARHLGIAEGVTLCLQYLWGEKYFVASQNLWCRLVCQDFPQQLAVLSHSSKLACSHDLGMMSIKIEPAYCCLPCIWTLDTVLQSQRLQWSARTSAETSTTSSIEQTRHHVHLRSLCRY